MLHPESHFYYLVLTLGYNCCNGGQANAHANLLGIKNVGICREGPTCLPLKTQVHLRTLIGRGKYLSSLQMRISFRPGFTNRENPKQKTCAGCSVPG